jgi:hypothetical protein
MLVQDSNRFFCEEVTETREHLAAKWSEFGELLSRRLGEVDAKALQELPILLRQSADWLVPVPREVLDQICGISFPQDVALQVSDTCCSLMSVLVRTMDGSIIHDPIETKLPDELELLRQFHERWGYAELSQAELHCLGLVLHSVAELFGKMHPKMLESIRTPGEFRATLIESTACKGSCKIEFLD